MPSVHPRQKHSADFPQLFRQLCRLAHQLAYNLCFNNNILKTQKKQKTIDETELNRAVNDFSSEKQDTYKSLYLSITKQREGKYKNVEIILNTLSNIPNEEITQHELVSLTPFLNLM